MGPSRFTSPSGGRIWWAHLDLTRMNIGPIIVRNQIEDVLGSRRSSGAYGETADDSSTAFHDSSFRAAGQARRLRPGRP